jgi:hypothetical protein
MGSVCEFTVNSEGRGQLTFGLLGKKKPQTQEAMNPEPVALSRLQEITGSDEDMYRSMSRLLFMDPKKVITSSEEAVSQAANFEATGDKIRAEVWYRIAGGIALYRGDAEAVRKFFEKAAAISGGSKPEYKTIASRAQEAVSIAAKYYGNL